MITVNKIMSKDLCSVDVGTSVQTAAEMMRRERIGSLLVEKKGESVGIVTERDVVWKVLGEQMDPDTTTVGMVMSAPLVTVKVGESLLEANERMDRTAIRHLPSQKEERSSGSSPPGICFGTWKRSDGDNAMVITPQRPPRKIQRSTPVFKDPYLPWGGKREVVMCRMCHAIYHHKRWYLEGEMLLSKAQKARGGMILCPACRKIQDRYPGGVITLQGEILKAHKDQILHLVRNQEARAKGINPLERIISIKDRGNRVEIQTTNERMAQRIGREIQRAYKGDAAYHWSQDDKFVRVEWRSRERRVKHDQR